MYKQLDTYSNKKMQTEAFEKRRLQIEQEKMKEAKRKEFENKMKLKDEVSQHEFLGFMVLKNQDELERINNLKRSIEFKSKHEKLF